MSSSRTPENLDDDLEIVQVITAGASWLEVRNRTNPRTSDPEVSSTDTTSCSSISSGVLTSESSDESIAVDQLGFGYGSEHEEQEDENTNDSFVGSDETDQDTVSIRKITGNTRRVNGIRNQAGYWQALVKVTKPPRHTWKDVRTPEIRNLTSEFIRKACEEFHEDMQTKEQARIVALRCEIEKVKEALWGESICTHQKLEDAFKEVTELLEE